MTMQTANKKLNKKLRDRYRDDPSYRDSVCADRRKRYRKARGVRVREAQVTPSSVRLGSSVRRVAGRGAVLCITTGELAALMGYSYVTVVRWQAAQMFPRPTTPLVGGARFVFTLLEARKLCCVMAEHQRTHQYLYQTDADTISRFRVVMEP